MHGQGIAGWIAVLTYEHKYIINEWNNHTEGGIGIGCWTLEIIGTCENESKKNLHKRTVLSLIILFHTGVYQHDYASVPQLNTESMAACGTHVYHWVYINKAGGWNDSHSNV